MFAGMPLFIKAKHPSEETEYERRKRERAERNNEAQLLRKEERLARREREAEERQAQQARKAKELEEERKTGFSLSERENLKETPLSLLRERCNTTLEDHKYFYRKSESIKNEVWIRYPRNLFGGLAIMCGAMVLFIPNQTDRLEDNFSKTAQFFGGLTAASHCIVLARDAFAKRKARQSELYGNRYAYLSEMIKNRLNSPTD